MSRKMIVDLFRTMHIKYSTLTLFEVGGMYSNMKSVKSRSSVNLETAKTEFRRKKATRFED